MFIFFSFFINKSFRYKFIRFISIVFCFFLFNPLDSFAAVTFGEVGVAFADSSGNVLYEVDKNDYNIELNVQNVKYILMYSNSSTIKNNGYNLFYDFAIGYQGMQYPVGINVTQLLENRNSIQFTPSLFNVEGQIQGSQGYYSRYHLNVDFIASSSNAWYQVTLQLPTEMDFTFYSVYNKKFTQTSGNSGSQIESSAEDIINNQNANTDREIESQKVCKVYDKNDIIEDGKYLHSNGALYPYTPLGVSDYINITSSTIKPLQISDNSASHYCFYNINKSLIRCYPSTTMILNQNLTIPNNSTYLRFTINKNYNAPQLEICKNGNQAIDDSINDLNNNINDDNVDDSKNTASSFFDNFSLEDNGGISSIVTLPLRLIRGLVSGDNNCSSLNFTLFDKDMYFPGGCLMWDNVVPANEVLYQTIICGFFGYILLTMLFKDIEKLKNPNEEGVSTLDL